MPRNTVERRVGGMDKWRVTDQAWRKSGMKSVAKFLEGKVL